MDAAKHGILECDPLLLKAAIEELAPPVDRRAECEMALREALFWVRHEKRVPHTTPAVERERYLKVAKALKALDNAIVREVAFMWGGPLAPSWGNPLEGIEEKRKFYEGLAREFARGRSGPQRGRPGRRAAVGGAYELLTKFGHRPTRTRDGKWHILAEILYDDPDADLFPTVLDYEARS